MLVVKNFKGYLSKVLGKPLTSLSNKNETTWTLFFLFLVVGIVSIVQILYLKPPAFGDQLDYFSTAANLPDVSATHRHLRIGLVFPVWLAIRIFGYSDLAYYSVVLFFVSALAGTTYLLGKRLFGIPVGVAAGLLIILNPYVFWDSSHLLPDIPAAACITAAVLCLIYGSDIEQLKSNHSNLWLFLLSGIFFGWGYLIREYTMLVFIVIPLLFMNYKINWKKLFSVGLGAFSMFTIEMIWGLIVYKNPFIRIISSIGPRDTVKEYATEPLAILMNLPNFFLSRPAGEIFVILFFLFFIVGTIFSIKGHKDFRTLLSWGGVFWLFITLIGFLPLLVFGEGRVLLRIHKFRYWLPFIPPFMIGITAIVYIFGRDIVSRLIKIHGLGILFLISIFLPVSWIGMNGITHSGAFIKNGANHYWELRSFLQEEGHRWNTIWVDQGHGRALDIVLPMYTQTFNVTVNT